MNSLRLRFLLPLTLFGFLPALGAARLMGLPMDWFYGTQGVLLGGGVFLAAYLISGWVLRPLTAMMNATGSLLRGIPPAKDVAQWLPTDYWKLRCDINMLFAKHRQSLSAAETHACQTAQRLANAERLLREAFTALQGIFSVSDEGVVVVDAQGGIIASNEKLDHFLGQPVDESTGRDFAALANLMASRFKDSPQVAAWIRQGLDEAAFQGTLEAETQDGYVFELRTAPMTGDQGQNLGRLWMIRDRTELRGLRQQLRESQKLGTIGQLAGGIAHDFNNMLTTIRGNLTLAEITPAGGDMKSKIKTANHATQRAADLVKQLLSYSRRGAGTTSKKVTNVKKLLADVESMLKHSVDPRTKIQVRAGMDASFVIGDAAQLEQVVLNLCLNARDALPPENGVIEIGIENITHRVPGSDSGPGEFTVITVRDNGRGITEEMRPHVFEPFFTSKDMGKGTGLGLSMAQDIVREHGGWIEFDSVVGQGTVFRVHLPRTTDPENVDDDLNNDAYGSTTTGGNRGTILVVDDEMTVRSTAVNMLNYLGYRTLEAADGREALEIVFKSGEKVDALMLDIYMPVLSGRDTFQQLRAAGHDVPVVICSGFVMDPDEFIILSQGHPPPVEIMLKPYSLDSLAKAMAKAVQVEGMGAARQQVMHGIPA